MAPLRILQLDGSNSSTGARQVAVVVQCIGVLD